MFKTSQESLKAHMDAAMDAAKKNDKNSMDINLRWAMEKAQTMKNLVKEEYKRDKAPAYQIWSGNRKLIERNAGEMGLDSARRTYGEALEIYNHIIKTFKNLKVELRQYYQGFSHDERHYQILKLQP